MDDIRKVKMRSREFDNLAANLRNWGRWGAEDQRGTLNHITPEALVRAMAEVTSGVSIRLGMNFDKDGPQLNVKRFNPMLYVTETFGALVGDSPECFFSDDVIHMPLQAATQWDALSHIHYDGLLYNGHKVEDTLTVHGACKLGVEHLASPGVITRGVLLDIPLLKNVDILPTDYAITPDDLNEACRRQSVNPRAGDAVLVRTGHVRLFTQANDRLLFNSFPQPGLDYSCAEWVYERNISALCSDNLGVEFLSAETVEAGYLPLHMICLRDMGCPLGEMFDLEALAEHCRNDGRYSFLLVAPALPVTGAAGSPINPIAIK